MLNRFNRLLCGRTRYAKFPGAGLLGVGLLCLLPQAGCHRQAKTAAVAPVVVHPAQTGPTPATGAVITASSAGVRVKRFQDSRYKISFDYPADWAPAPCKTAVLNVAVAGKCSPSLSLDVPKLPWHIPGMIPIGMVIRDYVGDVQKDEISDATKTDDQTLNMPGTNARRVVCRGHDKNTKNTVVFDLAVIMIHDDQVYILSADCDDTSHDAATKALDDAVASIKWAK